MPTASSPTMPMTPTENDAVASWRLRRPGSRSAGAATVVGASASASSAGAASCFCTGVSPVNANSRAAISNSSTTDAATSGAGSACGARAPAGCSLLGRLRLRPQRHGVVFRCAGARLGLRRCGSRSSNGSTGTRTGSRSARTAACSATAITRIDDGRGIRDDSTIDCGGPQSRRRRRSERAQTVDCGPVSDARIARASRRLNGAASTLGRRRRDGGSAGSARARRLSHRGFEGQNAGSRVESLVGQRSRSMCSDHPRRSGGKGNE